MCLKDFPRPTDVTGGHVNAYFDNLLYAEKNFHVLLLLLQQEILLAQMPLPWYNRSLGNQFLCPPVPAVWL